MIRKAEYKALPVTNLAGLEIELDIQERPVNTWVRLENFDLLVSGALRRIKGLTELIDHKYDTPIIAIRTYRRSPDDPRFILGLSASGGVYNLETGDLLTQFPTVNYAFCGSMTGIDEGLSSDDPDGPSTGKLINYFISTTAGFDPYKWNGIGGTPPTRIGVDPPIQPAGHAAPLILNGAGVIEDPTKGISILVVRRYQFTYWNPTTRHESSPSPDNAQGGISNSVGPQSPTVQATINQPFFTEIQMNCDGPTADAAANGYTRVRVYATRDGGQEFFLVPYLIARVQGGAFVTSDSDGSLLLTPDFPNTIWDGVRDFQAGNDVGPVPVFELSTAGFPTALPTQDSQLVTPGPAFGENDPPPGALWATIYQGRLWLQPADDSSRLVFSKTGDFQSYPVGNEIEVPTDDYNPITALDGQFTQLLIGKIHSTERITGSDLTSFLLAPLDPQAGFTGRRSLARFEGSMLFLSRIGVMQWIGDEADFYGRSIAPLTDVIPENVKLERLVAGADAENGFVLFSRITKVGEQEIYDILISNTPLRAVENQRQENPFSVMTGLTQEVTAFGESILLNDEERTLVALRDCRVYIMWENFKWFPAVAQTQLLPQDDAYTRKVFRYLRTTDGVVSDGFEYEVDIDGIHYPPRPLYARNFLGVVGKQIQITFTHRKDWTGEPPVLSNYVIEYATIGEAR